MQTVDKKYFLFNKGINTEAPLVGWPEGFTIDEQNFDLLIDGSRRRRPGLAPETPPPPAVPVPEPIPEPPPAGDPDCFNLYTASGDLARSGADGVIIDPELQFDTEANSSYWIYGHVLFMQTNAAGSPGAQLNFVHTGDTNGFQQMGGCGNAFYSTATVTSQVRHIPIDESRMPLSGYNSMTAVNTTYVYRVFVDAILSVGATPGTFGIRWGVANSGAAGSTARKAGSYITAIKVLEE